MTWIARELWSVAPLASKSINRPSARLQNCSCLLIGQRHKHESWCSAAGKFWLNIWLGMVSFMANINLWSVGIACGSGLHWQYYNYCCKIISFCRLFVGIECLDRANVKHAVVHNWLFLSYGSIALWCRSVKVFKQLLPVHSKLSRYLGNTGFTYMLWYYSLF